MRRPFANSTVVAHKAAVLFEDCYSTVSSRAVLQCSAVYCTVANKEQLGPLPTGPGKVFAEEGILITAVGHWGLPLHASHEFMHPVLSGARSLVHQRGKREQYCYCTIL